jgi:Ca-activated chloride channel family protein
MSRYTAIIVAAEVVIAVVLVGLFGPWRRPDLWFTAGQRGDMLMRKGEYVQAAKAYSDPARQGAALYRGGDFKGAAAAFARQSSAEGSYNRGNALVMLGKYDDAVKSYDRALSLRPKWKEANDNRRLAEIRGDRLKTEGGDETGGQVDPDEIVFGKSKHQAGDTVQVDGGAPLSDEQLSALWLRRVQTKPADFLRAKFAYQIEAQQEATK